MLSGRGISYVHTILPLLKRVTLVVLTAIFVVGVSAGYITPVLAITAPSQGLTIGSYNVHGTPISGENGCETQKRIEKAAANINSMGMDIVGLQEFADYDTSKTPSCNGKEVRLLDVLNRGGGGWKVTGRPSGTDGGGYQETQASIAWKSSSVTLASHQAKNVQGGGMTDTWSNGGVCHGGSPIFHIASFYDTSGKNFYVANGHWCTRNASQRSKDTQSLVNMMKGFAGAKIILGDTNSRVGAEVEKIVSAAGYRDSRTTAGTKTGASLGTMAGMGSSSFIIDRIYHEASVPAPTQYTTLQCSSAYACGSDHRPIAATFPSLTGGGGATGNSSCSSGQVGDTPPPESDTEKDPMTSLNQYRIYNNIPFTGASGVCCSDSTLSGSLVGNTNVEKAYRFLVSTPISTNGGVPLTAAQAAGVVGNLMVESTDALDPKITNSIGAFGIAQWLGGRKTQLQAFARNQGIPVDDFELQLKFIIYELEHSESAVIKNGLFKNAPNTADGAKIAAVQWDKLFERSGGAGLGKRQENAVKVFNQFANRTAADPATAPAIGGLDASTSAGCQSSTASGEYVFPLQASKADLRKWGANPGTTEWKSGRYHEGVFPGYYAVDIMAPEGTPVVAFHAGKVIDIGVDRNIYGALNIQILDTEGYTYYYQHLNSGKGAKVKVGDQVAAGTLIAYVGDDRSGWCSAPGYNCGGKQSHLHIDKSKNPGSGKRGSCSASSGYCPIASENRFVKIVVELHNSFEAIAEQAAGGGL